MFLKPSTIFKYNAALLLALGFFLLVGCAPSVENFTPERGAVGTPVTIEGKNFFFLDYVKIGEGRTEDFQVPGFFQFNEIRTKVPQGASTGKIQVKSIFYRQAAQSKYDFIVEVSKWAKTYGGELSDYADSIQQTNDGGYIVAGSTRSFGAGSDDFWVLKLDAGGNVIWQKVYGGERQDKASAIQQIIDGGYIVAGSTYSEANIYDYWILKLDAGGNIVWQKAYGGEDYDSASFIQQTNDGGYIVAGSTRSFGAGSSDVWILKLDADGNILWQKTYGGLDVDSASSVQQTTDGEYIVTGWTESFGAGNSDIWIIKLDESGDILWQKAYGGERSDVARSIQQTNDGGYIVAGSTPILEIVSYADDIWIIKLDADGDILWQKTYGVYDVDSANSIQQTNDGGYIVAGSTYSEANIYDYWILKLDAGGNSIWQKTYGGTIIDKALSVQQTHEGGYIVAGYRDSDSAAPGGDVWVLKLDSNGELSGPCGQDTAVIAVDTSVVPQETLATVITTSANVVSTTSTATDTDATITTQCAN